MAVASGQDSDQGDEAGSPKGTYDGSIFQKDAATLRPFLKLRAVGVRSQTGSWLWGAVLYAVGCVASLPPNTLEASSSSPAPSRDNQKCLLTLAKWE